MSDWENKERTEEKEWQESVLEMEELDELEGMEPSGEGVFETAEDGTLYKRSVAADESVLLIGVGDKITVKYTATDVEKICSVASWERT